MAAAAAAAPLSGEARLAEFRRQLARHERTIVEFERMGRSPARATPAYQAAYANYRVSRDALNDMVYSSDDFFIDGAEAHRDSMPPPGVYEWDLDAVDRASAEIEPYFTSGALTTHQSLFLIRWGTAMRGTLQCVLARRTDGAYVIFTSNANVDVTDAFVRRWSAVHRPDIKPEEVMLKEVPPGVVPRPPNFKLRFDYYYDVRMTRVDSPVLKHFREWAANKNMLCGVDAVDPTGTNVKDFQGLRDRFYRWYHHHRRQTLARSLALTDFRPRPDPPTAAWPHRPRLMTLPALKDVPMQLIMEHAATRAKFGGVAPARFLIPPENALH